MEKMDFDICVNTTDLKCPMPILKAKKALAGMLSQQILKVIVTDPSAVDDFKAFSEQTGNVLLKIITFNNEQKVVHIFIKKR